MAGTKQKQKRLRRSGKKTQKNCTRKVLMSQITMIIGHSLRDRHAGVGSQVGLKKHHYKQS